MGNQSAFVKNELGDELPRLTYYGVENNEPSSTFWLRDAGWFKIQNVALGYTLPLRDGNKTGLKSIRFNLMGNNLLTFTKIKYIDPEHTSAGLSDYPLFKSVTFGVKLDF